MGTKPRTSSLPQSTPPQGTTTFSFRTSTVLLSLLVFYILFTTVFTLIIYRILRVLTRPEAAASLHSQSKKSHETTQQSTTPTNSGRYDKKGHHHLLIVLGSGGHTSEMLSILQNLGAEYLNTRFTQRTWVVSSGDAFSAERAGRFEKALEQEWWAYQHQHEHKYNAEKTTAKNDDSSNVNTDIHWDIVTVTRARKVHQPLYTTPVSALACLWDCIRVLRGASSSPDEKSTAVSTSISTPDLILTNGPGTGVIVVLASLVLLVLGLAPLQGSGSMRCVYIESWARVKTLSLSGKMLRWMVSRFLVQWKGLADEDATTIAVLDTNAVRSRKRKRKVTDLDIDTKETSRPSQSSSSSTTSTTSIPRKIEFIGAVVT